jgi:hypothetical protein
MGKNKNRGRKQQRPGLSERTPEQTPTSAVRPAAPPPQPEPAPSGTARKGRQKSFGHN